MPVIISMGAWWLNDESRVCVSDAVTTSRCGSAVRAVRWRHMYQRTYKKRTIGTDSWAYEPQDTYCWNVPFGTGSRDPNSITDWFLTGAEYTYDPDSGEVLMTATCVQMGEDWDSVAIAHAHDGL